jgi:CO/xanthine dehydrogenase Mo-binding subunit
VPRAADVPLRFHSQFVENGDGAGPFGAKGVGEGGLVPVSPAIGNAPTRLTGVRLHELPLTPERVWRALRALRAQRESAQPESKEASRGDGRHV